MASVTLVKGTDTLVVSTTRAFVEAVYNRGYVPQTGTVESAYEIVKGGGGTSGQDLRFLYSTNGTVSNVIVITAAAYAALSPKDAKTQYVIIG